MTKKDPMLLRMNKRIRELEEDVASLGRVLTELVGMVCAMGKSLPAVNDSESGKEGGV